jgi:hypothetical protein
MVAKKALALCALSFLQTSFAGFERFWIFSKVQIPKSMKRGIPYHENEQRALIKRYESLKDEPKDQSVDLQQRMDWFTQLPEQEKQKMRDAWQKMSTQERNDLRKRMQNFRGACNT